MGASNSCLSLLWEGLWDTPSLTPIVAVPPSLYTERCGVCWGAGGGTLELTGKFSYFLQRTGKLQGMAALSPPLPPQLEEEKLVISLWGAHKRHLQVPSHSGDSGHLLRSMLMSFYSVT